jgi:hypothetical protein
MRQETHVKKVYAAIAASVAMLGISSTAIAAGPVTIVAVQPAQPGSGCAFFEVKGDPPNTWYAIALSDSSFNSQFGIIMSAFYSATPVTFATSGIACTYPKLSYIYVGTLN